MKIKSLLMVAILATAILCFGTVVNAQTMNVSALIAQLQAEVQSLIQQIAALQAKQGTTTTPITTTAPTSASAVALGSCNIDFTENNGTDNYDVDGYLGPNIYPLEASDWMHDSDIIKEVNTLTSGIDDNMDKAIAIANWVTTSRPYDYASVTNTTLTPANDLQSVVDIYNESTGVCLDSAIITVAMFRLAGIPARLVQPAFEIHAQAQAYINSQWITFDSTFGQTTAESNVVDFPDDVFPYIGELNNPIVYRQGPMQSGENLGSEAYEQFNTADDDSVFGKVTLANIPTNINLYAKDSLFDNQYNQPLVVNINITRTDNQNLYYAHCNNQISYIFSASQPANFPCPQIRNGISIPFEAIYVEPPANFANWLLPLIDSFDGGTQSNILLRENESSRYLETIKLPLGEYNITYWTNDLNSSTPNAQMNIASADFDVVQGSTVQLTSDKFSMASGANATYYNDIIKRLSGTWTNCANNPPPTTCTPNWNCSGFSTCVNGQQTQTCADKNNCGVTAGEPALTQSCTPIQVCPQYETAICGSDGKTYYGNYCLGYGMPSGVTVVSQGACNTTTPTCAPNWTCSVWNACVNSNQTRTCTDSNNCGITTSEPPTTQSCIVTTQPSITVTSPNGGEQWTQGSTQNITWTSTGLPVGATVGIGFDNLSNGASSVYSVANNVLASAGSYSWTIPATLNGVNTAGNQWKININYTLPVGFVQGSSANYFSVVTSPTVCTPNWQCTAWGNCTANNQALLNQISILQTQLNQQVPGGAQALQAQITQLQSQLNQQTGTQNQAILNQIAILQSQLNQQVPGGAQAIQAQITQLQSQLTQQQTRTCNDVNHCGVNTGEPSLNQPCTTNSNGVGFNFSQNSLASISAALQNIVNEIKILFEK